MKYFYKLNGIGESWYWIVSGQDMLVEVWPWGKLQGERDGFAPVDGNFSVGMRLVPGKPCSRTEFLRWCNHRYKAFYFKYIKWVYWVCVFIAFRLFLSSFRPNCSIRWFPKPVSSKCGCRVHSSYSPLLRPISLHSPSADISFWLRFEWFTYKAIHYKHLIKQSTKGNFL